MFGIMVLCRLHVLEYLRTLHLRFQNARTNIEVVLSLPCWLSQQLQFWSEPSETLNLRSSNTSETVAFTIPRYIEVSKVLYPLLYTHISEL